MFQISYSILSLDILTSEQRALYDNWQKITEEALIQRYGRKPRGSVLRMETEEEAIAREAYEDSLLEPDDRLRMRIGHFIEDYWRSLGPGSVDCRSVYEDEGMWSDDIIGQDGHVFTCYLKCAGVECEAKVLYLPGPDTLEVILASCDWEPEEYD